MLKPLQWIRLLKIQIVLTHYSLRPTVIGQQSTLLRCISYLNPWSYSKSKPTRAEAIRLAFEKLGPVFIKFAQMLSTRQDLLPADIIAELEKLQDRVPPFPGRLARQMIEAAQGKTIYELFAEFDERPLASASIAQVHAATLHDGSEVVIKLLRPNIIKVIRHDVAIMHSIASLIERLWSQGKRLHPVALVAEFERTILDELDLMREAANASQLRRNFIDSEMMYVPKIYWDYVQTNMMVMERISGIRISDIEILRQRKVNLKQLAEYGVEIFFTQVFRDNFFHADMHPGNIFVNATDPENPTYIGVDFGIMGSLSPFDRRYLAENLLAFFERDYHRVAMLHVESGWVPADTRVDQFEAAIRTVSEPIFERPLHEISFGKLLLRLFTTAERFNMEIQPQLMLLQKTLLSVEGLGRQLYPELDLWATAKPFMQRWIKQQYSATTLMARAKKDFPAMSERMSRVPKLAFNVLKQMSTQREQQHLVAQQQLLSHGKRQQNRGILSGIGISLLAVSVFSGLFHITFLPSAHIAGLVLAGGFCMLVAWLMPAYEHRG